ncbi:unnamed protein product [Closterium sp. NIES-54]
MTWVYVLSKKSDVAETVKIDWLPMVEQQQDRLVKSIRTDRGGEFLSKEFGLWLKKNNIRYSLTMPYSPTMNGIAERANHTITETARGLLIEAGLPDYFWPDAVRSACVAKNRALTHVGADKWVPYVEWIGRKPKVDMLRVFGCMCMALVLKHLRHNKLGSKAIWAVHLGMAKKSKGLILWDPFTKKFLVSRDCKFMENLMYKDWKVENEAKICMRFGEVKSSGLEHVELPLELSCGSTTRQSSLVNGGEEAKDAEEEEEEVQQVSERAPTLPSRTTSAPRIRVTPQQRHESLHVPAAEEEGRGKRRTQAPNRLTYEALGKPAKSALDGAAMMVGDDDEIEYEEFAFAFFSPVEMSGEPATLKEALEISDAEEWKKAMESQLKSTEENGTWELLRKVLEEIGFTPSSADHSLFMLGEGEQRSFMVVYVDDILIFSPSSDFVKEVMLKLQDKFKCKALGDVSFYLGLHIERDVEKRCMRVHQQKHLEALAANFGQSEGHVATPFPSGFKCVKRPKEESVGEEERRRFHSLVGSLKYAAVNTRPDVAFATGQLARVVQCPNEEQVADGMRVAKYLGQTSTVELQYSAAAQRRQKGADGVQPGRLFLTEFSDASYASEPEDMTSVGGFICCIGGGPTAWESKKQVDQALSSVESAYMALFRASAAASALVAELLVFAAACRLDYATALVAESVSASPPSVGDPNAPDIPTPRSYAEAITACTWLRRPPGFTWSFPAGTKWSLRRPVYGLHQAPSEWHGTLRTTLAALGFAPSTADPSLFLRTDTSLPPFYFLVYVDDLVFATTNTEALTLVKSELQKRHTCTDLGELHSYLGLQITRDRAQRTIILTQSHMVHQVLQRFGFQFSSPLPTPLSTSHSLSAPPSDESVEPSGRGPVVLTGHADASWVDDSATQRSSQGYTFSLGSGFVSWWSTRSSSILGSSCEAEIYARAMAAQELRWLTYLLTDLGEQPRLPPILYVDNKAMIALCQEHRLEHRTKHIALRYFLARELQQRGQLRLAYVANRANTADVFTKALPPSDH